LDSDLRDDARARGLGMRGVADQDIERGSARLECIQVSRADRVDLRTADGQDGFLAFDLVIEAATEFFE